jgi:peptide/nickel transport system substrate-binding protein
MARKRFVQAWLVLFTLILLIACAGAAPPETEPAPAAENTPAPAAPADTPAPAAEDTPEPAAPTETAAPTQAPEPTAEPTAEPAASEPTEFVFAHPGPIHTLDAPVTWYISTHWLANLMYDCLIWRSVDGQGYVGQAAEEWEQVDPLTWRFHLREGLTFHNGEPLDAEAVKWNIDRVRTREDFLVHPQWQFIDEVIVVDEQTVEITTPRPHAYFEFDVSFNGCQLLPPDYMEEVGEEEFARQPVGSGPYRLLEFTDSDRYVFEAWDDYWGGRPEVDRVVYQVIPEQASQIAALLAGQVDFVPNVPLPERGRLEGNSDIELLSGPANRQHLLYVRLATDYGAMAETHPGYEVTTSNKLIRQAISHALDRELLAEVQGSARPLLLRTDSFRPEHRGQWAGEEAAIAYYDPDLARELIREAGYDPDAGNRPHLHLDGPFLEEGDARGGRLRRGLPDPGWGRLPQPDHLAREQPRAGADRDWRRAIPDPRLLPVYLGAAELLAL